MRALTSSGVSHHEKDGQSFWKNRFFCGLLHFSGMVNFMVSVCVCVDSSLVFSPSASWVTCVGDFFALLFFNKGTGSGAVLSVSSLYSFTPQHNESAFSSL